MWQPALQWGVAIWLRSGQWDEGGDTMMPLKGSTLSSLSTAHQNGAEVEKP